MPTTTSGKCDHDYVFLIACGAMACIECAYHTSLETYTAMRERPTSRHYRHDDCNCGWADSIQQDNDAG
jgi:hypothetical protein